MRFAIGHMTGAALRATVIAAVTPEMKGKKSARLVPRGMAHSSAPEGAKPAGQRVGRKKKMNIDILNAPGDLFLGSDRATASALGARRFPRAAKAVRFAMEHAAPVSLRGARLDVGGVTLGPRQIRRLHRQMEALGQARRPGRRA